MVMAGHVLGGYNNAYIRDPDNWLAIANHIGRFGVELFFVLSGYVILQSLKRHDIASFIRHRFWRIYPVFLLFTVVYFAGNRFLHLDSESDSAVYLFVNLLFLDLFAGTPALTPNAWTITYEVCFYALSALLIKPILSKQRGLTVIATVPALLFAANYPLTAYFAAGMLIGALEPQIRATHLPKAIVGTMEIACIAALFFVLSLGKLTYTWQAIATDWRVTAAFVLTVTLFALLLTEHSALANALKTKPLLWLGTISYSLYLSHPYPYFLVKKILLVSVPTFLLIVMASSLGFAYLVHRLVERPLYERMTGKGLGSRSQLRRDGSVPGDVGRLASHL